MTETVPNALSAQEQPPRLDTSRHATAEYAPQLIRDVEAFLATYTVLPPKTCLPLSLWILLTYTFRLFDAVPYLILSSPAPRCGKTRVLECLEQLVSNPRRASNISEAALFRTIEKTGPTLLLDEAETLNSKSERAECLRQILNAGNRQGSCVTRCVGKGTDIDVADFSVFCPKIFAGIGTFPATLTDRAIVISMQRKTRSESVARFFFNKVGPQCEELRAACEAFVTNTHEEIQAAYENTDLDFLSDRDAEAWAPLFAILSIAAPARLGELKMCSLALTGAKTSDAEDESEGLTLLNEIRSVWPEEEPKIFTAELLHRLGHVEGGLLASEPKPNGRKLAKLLKPFGIAPASVQIGRENKKGFYRQPVQEVFDRYLSPHPTEATEPA